MSRMNYTQTTSFSGLMFSINCMDIMKICINNNSVTGKLLSFASEAGIHLLIWIKVPLTLKN